MATETREVTVPCPFLVYNEGEDDTNALPHECGADVVVKLEWEEGDSRYGADRDGNRWVSVPGQWVAFDVKRCAKGHKLDSFDEAEVEEQAEAEANDD